jgi:hypothetical protein
MRPVATIHLNTDQVSFRNAPEKVVIKLRKEDLEQLSGMLFWCIDMFADDPGEEDIDLLILEEIRMILKKKNDTCTSKAKIKLCRSQTRTLFLWLNEVEFPHPLFTLLARDLVDQMYRQII